MIPDLPEGLDVSQELDFYEKLLDTNESQGLVHIKWYSHSHDPSLCWICDRAILCHKMVILVERLLSKSAVDIETNFDEDSGSDAEIESANIGSTSPEYDVEQDELDVVQPEDCE